MSLPAGNQIIDAILDGPDAALLDTCDVVMLRREQWTTMRNLEMKTVDFPVSALLSVVSNLEDGTMAEVAQIGNEGFVEIDAALRHPVAKRSSLCRFPGASIRMPIADFRHALHSSDAFSDRVFHAIRSRIFMSEQLAVCNVRHTAGERLARWLLLASDRTRSGVISETQEQLAGVLGVRRASISVEASQLQANGAITYRRGVVQIENRDALLAKSCECYVLCRDMLLEPLPAKPSQTKP